MVLAAISVSPSVMANLKSIFLFQFHPGYRSHQPGVSAIKTSLFVSNVAAPKQASVFAPDNTLKL
jgi:hypothetical protein